MDYGMIGKIEKAKRYSEQRDRIRIDLLKVTFEGENNPHTVHFKNGEWQGQSELRCGKFASPASGGGTHHSGITQ